MLAGATPDVDFVVVRENTEGPYIGEGGLLRQGHPGRSRHARLGQHPVRVERCIRYAFDLARTRPRRKLTLCHKTNVLTYAGDLWQRTFDDVAADYPDVTTEYANVDAACLHIVDHRPGST